MERGTENPTLDMLIKISERLEVEMSELFDFSHQESTKALKELLKKLASQVDGDANLKMAVRLLRVITR
jgi:transcriptional regulator with XRE-family HTH domain